MINEKLTVVEVEEMLDRISGYEEMIGFAEMERDALTAHYNSKIEAANEICEQKCKPWRAEIALLTEQLRQYAEDNTTDKRRSVKLPSGTLSFRKQAPRFYFDEGEANAQNPALLKFVKANGSKYLKVEESVDWANLKPRLQCIGDQVVYEETGEIIAGMKAQILPDKFTVKTS